VEACVWRRAEPYVGRDEIDWAGLRAEAETMSGGEQVLVRVAHELWHAEKSAGLCELTRRLDARSFERVVEALTNRPRRRACGNHAARAGGLTNDVGEDCSPSPPAHDPHALRPRLKRAAL